MAADIPDHLVLKDVNPTEKDDIGRGAYGRVFEIFFCFFFIIINEHVLTTRHKNNCSKSTTTEGTLCAQWRSYH